MPKPQPVQYVLAKPTPPTWWKKNRHVVMLIVGLVVGGWLVSDHDTTATPPHDRPRPAHSAVAETE
ncbi:hypothetical protein [Streptomyces cavernicola]|uniref:Uncharacterized protein n=1 Tax=Streptomyces cavernicola TaxID=3043613 RepID=A0ABT6SAY0_9ACTN|nr:hypothetical protein [Streptomyces sp. B-S-A6]MDI3405114.1 hypothetical protein [Streptomyces sp. B-S-A6]